MSGTRTILLLGSVLFLVFCNEPEKKQPVQAGTEMPANAQPVSVQITDLNCWQERGHFYVTGICNSQSDQWQQIWLRMEPMDLNGKSLFIDGKQSAVFPVFSTAVPPRGRSAFFRGWQISTFSHLPDSCRITAAGAVQREAGPVLIPQNISGLRILTPAQPGSSNKATIEHGWQVTATITNPLEFTADRPFVELLVYGKDNLLWFSTNIDTEDPRVKDLMKMESHGPMAPGSTRSFTTQISYGNLPAQLNEKKIGKIEVLASENR